MSTGLIAIYLMFTIGNIISQPPLSLVAVM